MHGDQSTLFRHYVKGHQKAIFPWSLSIVDCFFITNAFMRLAGSAPVRLLRISANGKQVERVDIGDAYDMYDIDTEAAGVEVVLLHDASGSACYWDVHERFVVVIGSAEFLESARPYPVDIERHRYVEEMLDMSIAKGDDPPESVYDALCSTVF